MLVIPGAFGPISVIAAVRGVRPERVILMNGDENRQVDLGEIGVSQLNNVLTALRKSLSQINPLVAKWGLAGARAMEIVQQAGYRGKPSVLEHLIHTSQLPPEQFAQRFARSIQEFPALARMPHSLAFARLIRDGMGDREAIERLRALDSQVMRGMGGNYGGKMLASIAKGEVSFPIPRETGGEANSNKSSEELVVVHLDTQQVEVRTSMPRAQAIQRAIQILQALLESENGG